MLRFFRLSVGGGVRGSERVRVHNCYIAWLTRALNNAQHATECGTVACTQLVLQTGTPKLKLQFEVRDNILQRCQIALRQSARERGRKRARDEGQMLQSATYRCTLFVAHGTWHTVGAIIIINFNYRLHFAPQHKSQI